MLERLPDRMLTPKVAEAIMSPSGILLAGAGTSAAILAGAAIPVAAVVGLAAWAVRVAMAVPRTAARDRVSPSAVAEPWRRFVRDAQQAKAQFDQAVRRTRPGPLRDRLEEVGRRIADGVQECWRIACQGDALARSLDQIDVDDIRRELESVDDETQHARRRGDRETEDALAATRRALEAQLASAQRMGRIARTARDRLRLLNAQLDEAVARALELSVSATDARELSPLTDDVETLVGELESLRQAMEETGGPATATAS